MADVRVSSIDVKLRVIAIAMEPALALARVAVVPLDDVQKLVAAGYFREARSRGMSFRTIARRFDKSLRTITNLSKQSNEEGLPLEMSRSFARRRLLAEFVAGQDGPVHQEALKQVIPDATDAELQKEIEALVETGVLAMEDNELRINADYMNMVDGEELHRRLDSLRHFLSTTAQVAYRRFFNQDAEKEAFARVLTFQAPRTMLKSLREDTYAQLREQVIAADQASGPEDPTVSVSFCAVERPKELSS